MADARLMGADAVLLIAAALDDAELRPCAALADELGLAALVEVHDEEELARALAAGSGSSGSTSATCAPSRWTTSVPARWRPRIPAGVVAVAESGIRDAADARRLAEAGYDAILVGETLVRRGRPAGAAARARRAPRRDAMTRATCSSRSAASRRRRTPCSSVSLGASAVGLHVRPLAAAGLGAAGGRHRQAAARARADGRACSATRRRSAWSRRSASAGLGAAQLHGQETAEETQWVRARVPTVIKAFRAGERAIARFEEFGADYLLVDGDNPGSGQVFDWRLAEGVADHHRLIVSRRPAPRERGARRSPTCVRAASTSRPGSSPRRGARTRCWCATSSRTPAGPTPRSAARDPLEDATPRSPTTGGTRERREPA